MVILNILIRQIMINVIAVFMHNDYHNSKLIYRELQKKRDEEFKLKIKDRVKGDYKKKETSENN